MILDPLKTSEDLIELAEYFRVLYDARNLADYDHAAHFSRPGVLSLIQQAQGGLDALRRLASSADLQAFSVLIVCGERN